MYSPIRTFVYKIPFSGFMSTKYTFQALGLWPSLYRDRFRSFAYVRPLPGSLSLEDVCKISFSGLLPIEYLFRSFVYKVFLKTLFKSFFKSCVCKIPFSGLPHIEDLFLFLCLLRAFLKTLFRSFFRFYVY